MKALATIFLATAMLILIALIGGALLPAKHTVSRTVQLSAPPDAVWKVIVTWNAYPTWRREVASTERTGYGGRVAWREFSAFGESDFEIVEQKSPRNLVIRVNRSAEGVTGAWLFELTPNDGGTSLSFTGHGEIKNPLYRLVTRLFLGNEYQMNRLLTSLTAQLRR